MARRKKNPWTSTSEILLWLLFVALIFPAAFAGYAVGHYTSLGKPPATVTVTSTSMPGTVTMPTTTTSATTTSSSGGDVAAGEAVFSSAGCGACHAFAAAGSSGAIGPNLDTTITPDAAADNDMSLEDFVRQSIVDPSAYIGPDYSDGIMPKDYETRLKPKEIDDLVAFIVANTSQ